MKRRQFLIGAASLAAYSAANKSSASCGPHRILCLGKGAPSSLPRAPFVPLSGSAFDVNFATGQTSIATLANFSCTRAQTVSSYVTNADGSITACAADTLRIGVGMGLLIEESRTNLLLHTGDLTDPSWSIFLSGSGSAGTASGGGVAPDGVGQWTTISLNRSSTSDYALVYQVFTGSANPYSGGIYIKSNSASIGKSISIGLVNGTTTVGSATVILTGDVQRISLENVTLAASTGCQLFFGYFDSATGGAAGTGPVSFQAWGAQVEFGISLTSYIPNAGTQNTRNADAITANGIVLSTYQAAAVTQYARIAGVGGAPAARLGASWDSGATPAFKSTNTATAAYTGSALGTASTIGNGLGFATLGSIVNSVSSYSGSGVSSVANGGAETTDALTMPAVTSLWIGSDAGTDSFLNGYLARLAGWNSQLASATRIALSATFNTTALAVGGINTRYLVPNNVPLSGTFVMYHHGAGEVETAWTADALKAGTRESLLAQGHIISASAAAGDNWGNTAGLNAYVAQWSDVVTRYAPTKLVFLSQSMGGETGLLTIAAATMPVRGWYGIFPACNLATEYGLSFTAAINTAYNIPGGGTYAVQTAGHDPVLLSGSLFTIRMRFTGSASDVTVPVAQNAAQMKTLVTATALESFLLNTIGVHGDASNFIPSDVISFFARC